MILHVTAAKYRGGHRIWLRFDDGTEGVADLADVLTGPVFEPLRDVDAFKRFRLDPDLQTVVWENGADLAPEYLKQLVEENQAMDTPHRPSARAKAKPPARRNQLSRRTSRVD